jgi:hypothetical protein
MKMQRRITNSNFISFKPNCPNDMNYNWNNHILSLRIHWPIIEKKEQIIEILSV